VLEIPAGTRVPEHILRKWETIYPESVRVKLSVAKGKGSSKRAKVTQVSVKGLRR